MGLIPELMRPRQDVAVACILLEAPYTMIAQRAKY